jgi:hypothetical protein
MLWTSAKGSRLLDKINEETGSVFDKENYEIIVSQTDEVDGLVLGHFATEQPSRMTARHRGDTGRPRHQLVGRRAMAGPFGLARDGDEWRGLS